jgi:XapX domain-containing protein
MTFINALWAGLVVGGAYGTAEYKAPAPPLTALAGLLGMLAGAAGYAAVLYGLLGVRSPAPPLVGLTGLLGIVAGEAAARWSRHALRRRSATDIGDHQPGRS